MNNNYINNACIYTYSQVLHPTLLAASDGRLMMDQMNDDYARAMFSPQVEELMILNGDTSEADFVRIFRGGLITAVDEPAIPSTDRCRKLLEMDRYILFDNSI